MKTPFFIILALAGICPLYAQQDRVPSGLRPFTTKEPKKANEVTVVLDPPSSSPEMRDPEPEPMAPSLIENASSLPAPEPDEPVSHVIKERKPAVNVRVEKLQTPTGPVDAGMVKLLAPFPAKPLSTIPKGWKLDSSGNAPAFTREVEVTPGSKITLNIRPHVLIPDTDDATTFTVNEPGYEPALGYQQKDTVGAILSNSIRQLEEDSRQMGNAIDRIQQLLVSLPKSPEPVSEEEPPVAKPVKRK